MNERTGELSKATMGFPFQDIHNKAKPKNRYMLIKPAEAEQEKVWKFKVLFRNVSIRCRTEEILAAFMNLGYET